MVPQCTITNNRITIHCETLNLSEVELILPDNRRIIYTLDIQPEIQITPGRLTELAGAFVIHLKLQNRQATTITDYRKRLGQFCQTLTGETVSDQDWIAYYQSLLNRLRPISVRNNYRNLSKFAGWLVQEGHLRRNPLAGIRPPKPTKNLLPKAISPDDIRAMLGAAKTIRDKAILLFFWDTGCRAMEAVQLHWGDIDLEAGTVEVIGKGDKSRKMYFTPEITGEVLAAYRETLAVSDRNTQLFIGKRGPMTYSGLYRLFERTAKAAGLVDSRFAPHAWRHAFGRDTTISGLPTGLLQRIMGHSSIETTKIYLGFADGDIKAAHRQHSPVRGLDSEAVAVLKSR